jgi:hypothetical protein
MTTRALDAVTLAPRVLEVRRDPSQIIPLDSRLARGYELWAHLTASKAQRALAYFGPVWHVGVTDTAPWSEPFGLGRHSRCPRPLGAQESFKGF